MQNATGSRKLVVALHDVAPLFECEVQRQLDALAEIGVLRCALLVVPNWHGSHPLPTSPSLVDLLKRQAGAGNQLVLHGLEHRTRGALRGPIRGRLRAALFAPGVAEFLTLTRAQAAKALREGLELFARAGLPPPSTFCAPGWLLTSEAEKAVADAGLCRVAGMFSLLDLRTRRRRRLPSFGYMGASRGQELGVLLLNNITRSTVLRRATTAQVYLHPQGALDGAAFQRVLRQIAAMVEREGWVPATYDDL